MVASAGVLFLCLTLAGVQAKDFIDLVHAQGAQIAKEMVVEGTQVVWSPLSVVQVLPLIDSSQSTNQSESLKGGFKAAIEHLKELTGVEVARLSVAYLNEQKLKSLGDESSYDVELLPLPEADKFNQVLTEKYREEMGLDPPPHLIPESLANTSQVYLTSLMVRAEWDQPFKYAPKGRFYLNDTHAVKTKYMSTIGWYKHGVVDGIDAQILAIPFKNSTTTFFMVVSPNNSSELATVSAQLAQSLRLVHVMDQLQRRRLQLMLPKINVESQLHLEPVPGVRILQSGSLRLTYSGVDNRASKLRRSPAKFLNHNHKVTQLFALNSPFIFILFDDFSGVLNYGEVLMPRDHSVPSVNYKTNEPDPPKLTQNAKSLVEANNELGQNLYQSLRTSGYGSFSISPIVASNLLASYSTVGNSELFFGTLNASSGAVELNRNLFYLNSSCSTNLTTIETSNDNVQGLQAKVEPLGTRVTASDDDERRTTSGYYEYNYSINLGFTKKYVRTFYRNERDFENVSFLEHHGRVKYASLPFWDARAILLFASPTQSLVLLIPNERSGLHFIEEGLRDYGSVSKLLCQMRDRFVRIRIPFFEQSSELDLLPSIRDVFALPEPIGFNGLQGEVLSSLKQKVVLHIGGTKEQQSPKYRSKYQSRRKPSTKINVDRPFVYYLLDSVAGTLVQGRVLDIPGKIAVTSPPPSSEEVMTTVVP